MPQLNSIAKKVQHFVHMGLRPLKSHCCSKDQKVSFWWWILNLTWIRSFLPFDKTILCQKNRGLKGRVAIESRYSFSITHKSFYFFFRQLIYYFLSQKRGRAFHPNWKFLSSPMSEYTLSNVSKLFHWIAFPKIIILQSVGAIGLSLGTSKEWQALCKLCFV